MAYLESLAPPQTIHLGLERMEILLRRIGWGPSDPPALIVGGTNGKGSTVALVESILRAAGYRVGAYFSPHLLRYAERIRIHGVDIAEAPLCRAFAAAEVARGTLPLTFFEFGTATALLAFREAKLDCLVLEVGLGGRLDAVNAIDPIASAVTTVGIDHVEWLGADRESIGREKAGIFRACKPALVGDPNPPESLLDEALRVGAELVLRGRDFAWRREEAGGQWTYRSQVRERRGLPPPALLGDFQLDNAATALALVDAIAPNWPVPDPAVREGLIQARLPGRFEWRETGRIRWCLDVAHNPAAAATLARELGIRKESGPVHAILGMLCDKDVEGFVRELAPRVGIWHPIGLPEPRGLSASALEARVRSALPYAKIESGDPLQEL
ncbi:Folylpolyglutamate synthetase, partial [mine drainage metagenome]